MAHLRIDLDGIALDDEDGRMTAILRFRTTGGLVLGLPESVDVTIPWVDLEEARVDLLRARVIVRFVADAGRRHSWLGMSRVLSGAWTDRELLQSAPIH